MNATREFLFDVLVPARITYKPGPKESPGEWVFFDLTTC